MEHEAANLFRGRGTFGPDEKVVQDFVQRVTNVLHYTVEPVMSKRRGPVYMMPANFRYERGLRVEAPDDDQVSVQVEVQAVPSGPLRGVWNDWGRGEGHFRGGQIIVSVPVGWEWDPENVANTLAHELTHAVDVVLHRSKDKVKPALSFTPDGLVTEKDGPTYVNDPAEVNAVRHEIYREVASNKSAAIVAEWIKNGFPWRKGQIPSATAIAMQLVEGTIAWSRVGRLLSTANRHHIYSMVGPLVLEHIERATAKRVAARWLVGG